MLSELGIGFSAPALLAGLLGLPVLWFLLRAIPPAPIKRLFPGVILLLGLHDDENQTDKTPWWLLLLRMLAIACAIIGFSGPLVNPKNVELNRGPLLILMDASWASAADWTARIERVEAAVSDAGRQERPVAMVLLSDPPGGALEFQSADNLIKRLTGIEPKAWEPDSEIATEWAMGLSGSFDTFWFSDGLFRDQREAVFQALATHGNVRVIESKVARMALRPVRIEDAKLVVEVVRSAPGMNEVVEVQILGLDPEGIERELDRILVTFQTADLSATAKFEIQPELRNRISRFVIQNQKTAGAVVLSDDGLKRQKIALIAGPSEQERLQLLSQTHFLTQALKPNADLIQGTLDDMMPASPGVIVLADVATLSQNETDAIVEWVSNGGQLLRFAGPRLAASDVGRGTDDPLMPVRLRAGGRTVGGTMSWGEPKKLREFSPNSPFYGLSIPDDVEVSAQVMAEPDPNLATRVIATLSDGTPLVTRKKLGKGQVVLFHVTANAEWSSLPLSVLFIEMLDRLAVSSVTGKTTESDLTGTTWLADRVMDGYGQLQEAENRAGIPGEAIAGLDIGKELPPGIYQRADQTIAVNVIGQDRVLAVAEWPDGATIEGFATPDELPLKAYFLIAALLLLATDAMVTLWLGGRLRGAISGASIAVFSLLILDPRPSQAQDEAALAATSQLVLAHVLTGNDQVDRVAHAGLRGLSDVLFRRTSVEPADPIGIDIETDELAFFPFLYWPISADQPLPSVNAVTRLNRYIKTGGMILFDTRDSDVAGYGVSSRNGRKLQQIAGQLDAPPLEPMPEDHVLSRTFYLLDTTPGRYYGRPVWVESSPANAELAEGMPFRNLNDNVSPLVIGGNDWAAAWAVDEVGNWMFPIGRGSTGQRQRELANRFGVNLIMYVLTGNYKSDQVHVPALLDRLGQ